MRSKSLAKHLPAIEDLIIRRCGDQGRYVRDYSVLLIAWLEELLGRLQQIRKPPPLEANSTYCGTIRAVLLPAVGVDICALGPCSALCGDVDFS